MSLEDTLSNLNIYDAKKYFRKAQNVMFNYTDMEAKVREATNNEPWGASSTLMEQIAQGTYNIREREEVLSMIFRRFTEKTASEWRQIYKSLQLLDYLIKHGSERFIDDVRTSLSLIKMLESFHYIDSQNRDQGVNVRNKAQSLTVFLKDDELIRAERKRARETSKKFRGVAGGTAAGLQQNPRAGFTASNSQAISVSADFDSEDETDDRHVAPKITTSDGMVANSDDLFTIDSSKNRSSGSTPAAVSHFQDNGDDDEDDEFAEFQSAAPVAPPVSNQSAHQAQSSLFDMSQPISNDTSASPQHYNAPEVIPAVVSEPKKVDPFGSLFMTAKATKPSSTPVPTRNNTTTTAEDDDDIFGDLTAASTSNQAPVSTSEPAPVQAPTNSQTQTKTEEIDLLDF